MKTLKNIVENIEIWEGWRDKYKEYVPLFIEEASKGKRWQDWDNEVFYEFFEKSSDQCVSSLKQGYFHGEEKENIKENWDRIAPLLQKIALSQNEPLFEVYYELKEIIREYTYQNKKAATNRLIASLQPSLLCTIVNEDKLASFIKLLNDTIENCNIQITWDWYKDSNAVWQYYLNSLDSFSVYDNITLPWQTYDLFINKENETNEMSEILQDNPSINLLYYKKQIILQGPPGTGKTTQAKLLAKEIIKENSFVNKTFSIKTLTKDYIKSHLVIGQKIKGKNNKEFEVIDLDKNVVLLKSETSKPWKPSYNKIIDSFDNKLFEIKGRTGGYKSYEDAIAMYFYENHLSSINEVEKSINEEKDFLQIIQFHPSYTYEDFVRGIIAKPNEEGNIVYEGENKIFAKFAENALDDPENKYILIVDEINRANLSSVLGELIYALEYRGEEVESMYEVDGSQKLILPPNLYIIGTMNTADRSVGHIDYAVRRRFAFVDVLPIDLTEELGDDFKKDLFLQVKSIFTSDDYETNSIFISEEFKCKDVALGHSYFIDKSEEGGDIKTRWTYEIKPILLEYLRDGILKQIALDKIKEIEAVL